MTNDECGRVHFVVDVFTITAQKGHAMQDNTWRGSAKRPPLTHELKTDPEPFDAVSLGFKRFEIRRDDRDFQQGDFLKLRKTVHTGAEMAAGSPLCYVGAPLLVHVIHVLRGPVYGLAEGWCIMSVEVRDNPVHHDYEVLTPVFSGDGRVDAALAMPSRLHEIATGRVFDVKRWRPVVKVQEYVSVKIDALIFMPKEESK